MDINLLTFISAIKDIRRIDISRLLPNLCMEEYGLLKLMKTRLLQPWDQESSLDPDKQTKEKPEVKEDNAPSGQAENPGSLYGHQNEGIKVSSLVKGLNVPASVVSRTLRSLDKKEMVTRTVDEADRRNILVWITPQGEEAVNQADKILEDFIATVFKDIGEENIKQFFSTLKKLQDSFSAEIDKRAKQNKKK